ncbi:TIR domain containing protein [Parasponia andersonii]|uniref:TIR domain containing protein n=1 Tax=Parasponia andersonii TaxID=3476 RepID=A0A2P5A7Q4_PARAD|nr:TIR domain containing protein [Parasponia andersonii]
MKNIIKARALERLAKRVIKPSCEVFINHRGVDTKRSIATLLYDQLSWLDIHPFLDNKTMKPGDKLFDKIDSAIMGCKVGVAVFSPRYCESYFCLHELALFVESKKKVIPIFCDVKPSQLRVGLDSEQCSEEERRRFASAIEKTKNTVGLTFDSSKGNLSDVVRRASNIVINSLIEIEKEKQMQRPKSPILI